MRAESAGDACSDVRWGPSVGCVDWEGGVLMGCCCVDHIAMCPLLASTAQTAALSW